MSERRCKHCPYKKTCRQTCYGSQPCEWALAMDKLVRKLERWKGKAEELERKLTKANQLVPRFYGDYVFSPCQNAFNQKTSWWLSKKDCTVALYCFTAETTAEVDAQLVGGGGRAYIRMFEEAAEGRNGGC